MARSIKQQPPQGFTPALAVADAFPVVFFGAAMLLAAQRFCSVLFGLGAAVITLAGCGKVLWKLLLGVWKRNVPWLNRWFIPCQITGFLLAVAGLVLGFKSIAWAQFVQFPTAAFLLLWLVGLGIMGWYRRHRFDNSLRANWTAQCINTAAQGALLVGILLMK